MNLPIPLGTSSGTTAPSAVPRLSMLERGYISITKWRGVDYRVHWLTFIVMVLLSDGPYSLGRWCGFFFLVLVHEWGHAFVARGYALQVYEIRLLPLGGQCIHEGAPFPKAASAVAWGGVMAQALLFLPLELLRQTGLWPGGSFFTQLAFVYGPLNLAMILFNLLPFRGLDGYLAWQYFSAPAGYWRWKFPRTRRKPTPKRRGTKKKGPKGKDNLRILH